MVSDLDNSNIFKIWYSHLNPIKFNPDNKLNKNKILMIFLIRIIFIRILSCFSIIPTNFLLNQWNESKNNHKDKKAIIYNFLSQLDLVLDLTQFNSRSVSSLLEYINDDPDNLKKLFETLEILLLPRKNSDNNQIQSITSYNFRKLESDKFGLLYEELLNNQEKKSKGIFYTPSLIVNSMLHDTVGKKFENLIENITQKLKSHDLKKTRTLLEKFATLSILDPACGSGIFLINSIQLVYEYYIKLEQILIINSEKEFIPSILNKVNLVNIVKRHIFGIDIDNTALEVTRLSIVFLLLNLASRIKSKNLLFDEFITLNDIKDMFYLHNLRHTDALINLKLNQYQYDVVIGNPPYLSSKKLSKSYKSSLQHNYLSAQGQFDLYSLFIEYGINKIKMDGLLGFIIPDSLIGRSNFARIRLLLLHTLSIKKLHQIKGVFENPTVSNIILIAQKDSNQERKNKRHLIYLKTPSLKAFQDNNNEHILINQNFFQSRWKHSFLFINPSELNILNLIEEKSVMLEDLITINRGEEIGKSSTLINKKANFGYKLLTGENIQSFEIKFNHLFIQESDVKKNLNKYLSPKILFRQLGKSLNVAYDELGEYITLQTIYNIYIRNNQNLSPFYLLGLLNSRIINYYYIMNFKNKDLFPRILLENIKKIPVKTANKNIQQKIANNVKKIITLKQQSPLKISNEIKTDLVKNLEEKIDTQIFHLYQLSTDQIRIVLSNK